MGRRRVTFKKRAATEKLLLHLFGFSLWPEEQVRDCAVHRPAGRAANHDPLSARGAAEILALRHQLAVVQRATLKRPLRARVCQVSGRVNASVVSIQQSNDPVFREP